MSEVGLEATLASANPRETIRPKSLDATLSADALNGALAESLARAAKATLEPMAPRFVLGATLGQGGMAVVRVGRQKSLDREVALKMMRGDSTDDASPRMLREAWITGALEHPNIVPVHDLGIDESGRPMLVLKRIEGKPWSELIAGKSLEWNLQQLVHVCNAIAFAHSRGIVHRDLKPANIMIGEFGEVNVLDWGIAVSLVDDGSGRLPLAADCKDIAGTLAYMAPEMLGSAPITAQTDVYLLGAILFEIATGKPPHLRAAMTETIASIRDTPPSVRDDVPTELAAICRRALARTPADRFASAEAFRDALTAYLAHRGSFVLAEQARDQLRALEAHFASARDDAAAHRARAYELFGEARFGFQAALRAWPENVPARDGLERALVAMASYELDHGEPRAAAVLLAEVREPSRELRDRLASAERAVSERNQRLERFEADADVESDSALRTVFLVVCGIVWTCVPLSAALYPPLLNHASSVATTTFAAVAILVFGVVARVQMMRTTWNRGVYLIALLGMILQGMVEAIAWAAGYGMVVSHVVTLTLWAGIVVVAAIFLDRALIVAGLGFVAAGAVMAWRIDTHTFALAAAVAILLGTVLYIHLCQKHGRKIAGYVELLRPKDRSGSEGGLKPPQAR